MKKLKIIFNGLYFAYLFVSVLMFILRQNIYEQAPDLAMLLRFLNFWILLGFFFLIVMWVIQTIHIRFLRKDMEDKEKELLQVKLKLYDIDRGTKAKSSQEALNQKSSLAEHDIEHN